MIINTSLAILFIALAVFASGGGLYWYFKESQSSLVNYRSATNLAPTSSSQTTIQNVCRDFQSRFGTTPEELVMFINDEPDAAALLMGFKNVLVFVKALPTNEDIKIILKVTADGKISSYSCDLNEIKNFKSSTSGIENVEFIMPENDFAQIVRYRENLETAQLSNYLQNTTSNPVTAKSTLMRKIQELP